MTVSRFFYLSGTIGMPFLTLSCRRNQSDWNDRGIKKPLSPKNEAQRFLLKLENLPKVSNLREAVPFRIFTF